MTPHLLINGWFWGQTSTGSGQYLAGLLRQLPKVLPDWRLTLALPELPSYLSLPPAPDGVDTVYFQLPSYARGARLVKLTWEQQIVPTGCRQLRADVAFVPYWGSPFRSPCPVVVTIHDLIPLLLPDYATKSTARAYTWLVVQSARRAQAILTVSQSAYADIVRHLGLPPDRVHVTYESLGYPHAPVSDRTELERVRKMYDLPARFLFYLGGFDPRKNVPLLLHSYHRARTLNPELQPLLIAGRLPDPDDTWSTDPRPIIAELKLQDHVRPIGFVPDQDKPSLYTLADLFVFPSRFEGFGLPPLEAMSCGTAALVSDSSSLPEIVGDTLNPVAVNDEHALATGIINALGQLPRTDTLLAQAARFSWEDTAAKVATVLRKQTSYS